MTGQIAVYASNPREVWGSRKLVDINTGTNNHDMPVYVWDQACSADFAPSTPLNAAPQYSLHDTGWKLPLDGFPNFCLFFSSTGWGIFGPPVFLTDSNYLYAFWVYWPKTDSGDDGSQQYWTQFIVTRWPINRDTITCGTLNTPIFTSRFRGSDD